MAVGLRKHVEKGQYVIVFVEIVARGIAANDLSEDVLRVVGGSKGHVQRSMAKLKLEP